MKKLIGTGVCFVLALLLSSCQEHTKPSAAKELVRQGKDALEDAGKAVQEVDANAGEAAEAAVKALADTKAKIGNAAKKAADALGSEFTKATEQAMTALKDVKGGSDVLEKIGAVFPALQETLAGISDKETAQSAMPRLEELDGTVSKLSGQLGKLPEEARQTIGDLVQKGTSSIQPLVDQVLALPAVQAIRPKVEEIMNKLKSLKS